MGVTVVTPAMAKLAAAFPGENYVLISTLPTLFVVAGTFLAGSIAGKKVSYRFLAILGSILFFLGGCAPAFTDSFSFILFCRAVLGLGLGLLAPLGNALVIGNYEGQKQATLIGYGTLFMNAGGIVFQVLGGILADINWHMTFWGHALSLIALVLAFFLPEPPKIEKPEGEENAPKEKMGKKVWIIGILFMVINILNYPVMMNISILFEMRNAGGATAAATALSLFTVAGCVAGLIFGQIFKNIKRFCISLGYILCALGAALIRFGNSGPIMTIGLITIGFGFSIVMPAFMTWIGFVTPPSTVAIGTSVALALMNLGGFLCTYWLEILNGIFGESIFSAISVEIFIFAGIAAVFLFVNPFKSATAAPKR